MIEPDDIDRVADYDMEGELDEAGWRAAVNRAYYFLYHDTIRSLRRKYPAEFARMLVKLYSDRRVKFDRARVLARDWDYTDTVPAGLHSAIPRFLRSRGYKKEAGKFKELKCARAIVDYQLGQSPRKEKAIEWMQDMRDLARRIREI